jgi:hypothetical protein
MNKSIRFLGGLSAFALGCLPAFAQTTGPDIWMKMYDGKTLDGWKGREQNWKVDTGAAVTASGATSSNTFLVSDSSFSDFHFKLECKLGPTSNNSGIIHRGKITNQANYVMSGYQYEISGGGTGAFYHEQGNEIGFTRIGGCYSGGVSNWTKMEIVADGPKVTHLVAGNKCFEKLDMKVVTKGQFGLQLHSPGNFTVSFRNIFIKPLNGSFQIPADNAWDGNGVKLGTLGMVIKPKRAHVNRSLGIPAAVVAYDARGRLVPAAAAKSLPTLVLMTK